MAVTFVEFEDYYAGGSSAVIPAPASVQDGDLMVAIIGSDVAGDTISAAPAGWTKQIAESSTSAETLVCYTKVASSESGTYTFTWTSSDPSTGHMFVFRDAEWDTSTTTNTEATTAHTLAQVTTSYDNCVLIHSLTANWNETYTAPGGSETVLETAPHGGTGGFGHGAAYEAQANAGASGTKAWVYGGSRSFNGYLISLAPAGSGAGGGSVPTIPRTVTVGTTIGF